MAIQMRRGKLKDYDPLKMRDGEIAITTDSETARQKAKMAFGKGVDKTVLFEEDYNPTFTVDFETGHLHYRFAK